MRYFFFGYAIKTDYMIIIIILILEKN